MVRRSARYIAFVLILLAWPLAVSAQPAEPRNTVERLNETLLDVMQNAQTLGYQGRYERLEPVLRDAFSFPVMARIAVGEQRWQSLDPRQQRDLVQAFSRMSIANFAARFDGYSGQRFEILGVQTSRGDRVQVNTRIVRPGDEPVNINYLLQEVNGDWQIIDVFLNARISELAQRRSEYASVYRQEGFDGLIARIESTIDRLSRESQG